MQVLTTTRSPGEVLDGSQGCVCSLSSRSGSYLDLGAGVEGGVIRVEDDVAAARRLRGKTGTDVRAGITLERATRHATRHDCRDKVGKRTGDKGHRCGHRRVEFSFCGNFYHGLAVRPYPTLCAVFIPCFIPQDSLM